MIELAFFMVHCVGAFGMMGIQWFRQVGIYPVIGQSDSSQLVAIMGRQRPVAAVFMGLEACTGLALLAYPRWLASGFSSSMALLAVIWGLTFLVGRPLARKIRTRAEFVEIQRLARVEWIRTVGWTLRAAILILVALV